MEATAPKPGNVHPGASFPDLSYADFVNSAAVIAPLLANLEPQRIGLAIKKCISETQNVVASNSNLGMVLLLAPLAAVPQEKTIAEGIHDVLQQLTNKDAEDVYDAIRIANPGGLGKVEEEDVDATPEGTLKEVMGLAADRDSVASEYANDFRIILQSAVPALQEFWKQCPNWEEAVIRLQLRLMSDFPDTLIARKCGIQEAEQSASRAMQVLNEDFFDTNLSHLDSWLRQKGNQRNPGTTADLIVAALFVATRDGFIPTLEMSTILKKIPEHLRQDLKLAADND